MSYKKYIPLGILLLQWFMALVFLSAGIYRIFSFSDAVREFSQISQNFSIVLLIATITIEIAAGILLILRAYTKQVAWVLTVFLGMAITVTLARSWENILPKLSELFYLDSTPTDIFLHFTYIIILASIILFHTKNTP